MLPVLAQRPTPEISRAILSGDLYRDKASHLLSFPLMTWARRYAYQTRQATNAAKASAMMVFADMEIEMGPLLDWVIVMAAAEGIPTGVWIAQVVKQYADAFKSQENSRRNVERRGERERKRVGKVERESARAVVTLRDALPNGGRSNQHQE